MRPKGLLFTSSITDMRLNAWMAASCTDSVVAGCLMHLTSVFFMEGLTASSTSPMLPATCDGGQLGTDQTFTSRAEFGLETYPQGQKGQIFIASAVCGQERRDELRHSCDFGGDALRLIQPSNRVRH